VKIDAIFNQKLPEAETGGMRAADTCEQFTHPDNGGSQHDDHGGEGPLL